MFTSNDEVALHKEAIQALNFNPPTNLRKIEGHMNFIKFKQLSIAAQWHPTREIDYLWKRIKLLNNQHLDDGHVYDIASKMANDGSNKYWNKITI